MRQMFKTDEPYNTSGGFILGIASYHIKKADLQSRDHHFCTASERESAHIVASSVLRLAVMNLSE